MSNINYANGLNGGTGRRGGNFMSSVDFYRRVPKDLTEATTLGAAMSVIALLIMSVLFLSETLAFARTSIVTSISLDDNVDPQIRLNFNITFFQLHCDYVSVDVWDSLGTNKQNITKNVEKWQLDADGTRRIFSGRNRETREVKHEEHSLSLSEMHDNGVHVAQLDKNNFQSYLDENDLVFVNFHVPWCVWCQRLAPTWEMFAEDVEKENMPLKVAGIDCTQNANTCRSAKIMAFPCIRWYQNGEPVSPDYKQDRTVAALKGFSKRKIELLERYKDWEKNSKTKTGVERAAPSTSRPENPGCQVSGHLLVNRVPGNFHVEARSKNHNLNAAMTNLTHRVNHLSFGDEVNSKNYKTKRILKQVPEEHKQFNPIDDSMYFTKDFHQAWHHYIKVVSTHLELDGGGKNSLMTYQFLEQSQIVHYDEEAVPEARFSYDISPMSVVVQKEGRKWYDYLTSLCAIIGGSFTTLGLIDASLYKMFKAKKS